MYLFGLSGVGAEVGCGSSLSIDSLNMRNWPLANPSVPMVGSVKISHSVHNDLLWSGFYFFSLRIAK